MISLLLHYNLIWHKISVKRDSLRAMKVRKRKQVCVSLSVGVLMLFRLLLFTSEPVRDS